MFSCVFFSFHFHPWAIHTYSWRTPFPLDSSGGSVLLLHIFFLHSLSTNRFFLSHSSLSWVFRTSFFGAALFFFFYSFCFVIAFLYLVMILWTFDAAATASIMLFNDSRFHLCMVDFVWPATAIILNTVNVELLAQGENLGIFLHIFVVCVFFFPSLGFVVVIVAKKCTIL